MTSAVTAAAPRLSVRAPEPTPARHAPLARPAAAAHPEAPLPSGRRPTQTSAAEAQARMRHDVGAQAWRHLLNERVPAVRDDLAVAGAAPALPASTLPPVDLARGAQGPEVQAVQQALVDGGYLTAQQMATGPGIFGPQTQAALEKLQRERGLPVTGRYDAATREALGATATPGTGTTPTAPSTELARGARGPEVEQLQDSLVSLGYLSASDKATGPGEFGPKTEAAVRRFQVEHGIVPPTGKYDAATQDWMKRRLAGEEPPPPPPPGELPTSAADANQHFVTQFTSDYNPTGPSSSANCGPASVAMALDASGRMPAGLTPEQRIDYARSLMNPSVTPSSYVEVNGQRIPQLDRDHDYSGTGQVEAAFNGAGGTGYHGSGWDELDAALRAGDPVVASGYYSQSGWGKTLEGAGTAQGVEGARAGGGNVGHFNAILGLTPDGRYIVADPMYTGGTVELTREQLAQYFSPTGGVPSFTALS